MKKLDTKGVSISITKCGDRAHVVFSLTIKPVSAKEFEAITAEHGKELLKALIDIEHIEDVIAASVYKQKA